MEASGEFAIWRRANSFETPAETLSGIFFRQPAFKLCNKLTEFDSEGIADHPQLDDINAPPTALNFADSHLLKGKSFGQLTLAESKSLPNFSKELDENCVFSCMYTMSGWLISSGKGGIAQKPSASRTLGSANDALTAPVCVGKLTNLAAIRFFIESYL